MSSLKNKTFFGLVWNIINNSSLMVLNLVITAILARLLSPKAFGIMGMVQLVIMFISKINEFGLSIAIVQEDTLNQIKLSSLFYFNVLIGILMTVTTYISADIISNFFEETSLVVFIKMISIVFLIVSFSLIQKSLLRRNMEFKKIFIIQLISLIIYGVITIILAYKGFGVRSLIYGYIAKNIVDTILYHIFQKWYPSLNFDFNSIKDLLSFGGYLMGSSFFGYFNNNLDYLIIGRILGATALGYYTIAFRIITIPTNKIGLLISKTFLPAFSKIKKDKKKIKKYYLKVIEYISLITFPMMVGMAVVAEEFTLLVYGDKWVQSIVVIQILAVAGLFKSLTTTVGTIFFSQGRSDITFKWNIFKLLNLLILMYLGTKWGLIGVAIAVSIFNIYIFPIIFIIVGKIIDMNIKEIFFAIRKPSLYSLIMGLFLLLFEFYFINNINIKFKFSILVIFGGGIYLFLVFLFDRKYYKKQFDLIKSSI
jgi:PST family polysaccharide transporter